MAHRFIKDIDAGETIDDVYIISQPILRSTTRGDLYIAAYLCDRSGRLNGRMWQATEDTFKSIPREGFVHIKGRSEVYQNAIQIVVSHISVVRAEEVTLEDFLARTSKDVNKMFARVKEIVGQVKNEPLQRLIEEFLTDGELMGRFCQAPAAMLNHHNYLGGLLEHTLNMLEAASVLLPLYPKVQPDLVLAGIFLHDIGKTAELSYDMAFGYTDSGQLLGHINQTVIMVEKKADLLATQGVKPDRPLLDNLEHIILSHHGAYEFGSPKLPATLEAFMVNYIDNLDAKMNQVSAAIENEPGDGNWTNWQRNLETKLYRKRLVD
ncbi:MAG: HD domain-containing protein [Planctomycetota bacterium]